MALLKNMMNKQLIALTLMTLTTNSYASDCPELFDRNNPSAFVSIPLLTPHESKVLRQRIENNIKKAQQDVTDQVTKVTSISPNSKDFDTFSRNFILFEVLNQEIKLRKKIISYITQLSETANILRNQIYNIMIDHSLKKEPTVLVNLNGAIISLARREFYSSEAIKAHESNIQILKEELNNPANKDKQMDTRLQDEVDLDSFYKKEYQGQKDTMDSSYGIIIYQAQLFIKSYN